MKKKTDKTELVANIIGWIITIMFIPFIWCFFWILCVAGY